MRYLILILLAVSLVQCKSDKQENTEVDLSSEKSGAILPDGTTLLRGEFIVSGDAAVLTTSSEIYGVVLDDAARELEQRASKFKKGEYDMVAVVLRGKVIPSNKPDGWEKFVEIKEVMHVERGRNNNTTVIQSQPEHVEKENK